MLFRSISGSRSDDSTHCELGIIQIGGNARVKKASARVTHADGEFSVHSKCGMLECFYDESLRSVYFPTNAIVTELNSLPWLMMKRISDRLSKERESAHPDVISFHRFIKNRPLPFISSETDTFSNSSRLVRNSMIPWLCNSRGT